MELEKAAKKANVLAFMMNKQEQKNVLCPATLHTRPQRYLFITELSLHITFLIYKIAFSVFVVLFVAENKRQMLRRRARSAFSLLATTPKPKKSLDEKFPYLYGGAFELILYLSLIHI